MSREIKFRAYCKECQMFVPVLHFMFQSDGEMIYYCPMHEGGVIKTKLTQFTGLRDKNGVEIYEGDICDEKYKWVISFKKGCFMAETNINPPHNNRLLYKLKKYRKRAGIPLEVIGNIYENPNY